MVDRSLDGGWVLHLGEGRLVLKESVRYDH